MTGTHFCTIREFAQPVDGYTHVVRTPCLRVGVEVQSIHDARRLARGFGPADTKPVTVIEIPSASRPRKTIGLRLSR
jgi:hypothetical protein